MVKKLLSENFQRNVGDGAAIVDFYADWCGPCKRQAPIMENIARRIGPDAKVYKVNVDESAELASRYNVTSIPTILIFKDGKVVESMVGLKSESALLGALERLG
jgi:thioredoxin 1